MPAPSIKFSLLPNVGRGLITNYSPHSMAEFVDSFVAYRDIFDGGRSWFTRTKDTTVATSPTDVPIRALHFFNRVIDSEGTLATILLAVCGAKVTEQTTNTTLFTASYPYAICFENVKNRCFMAGANNTPRIYNGTATVEWGADGPSADMTYEPFNVDDADTKVEVGTSDVVINDATVTRASGSNFTTGGAWDGKQILLDGAAYTISTVTNTNSLELTEVYKGETATGISHHVHYGAMSWGQQPPIYAYAYYNDSTGHITNRSPLLALSEQNMVGVRVALGNIVTDSTLNTAGYTKIVLFRTAKGGGTLYPLKITTGGGYLTNSAGPLTYNDEGDDTQLGLILGLKEAPTINNKPPTGLRYIAYYQGRFWGVDGTSPWRLRFSGDVGQIPLGVPEECWPEENFRDITGANGFITGLKVVGTTLLVCTERWIFYVTGSSHLDYDLSRLSARGVGVRHWAIDEHPGDTTAENSSAIYIGRDRRVWRHYAGGQLENIGDPIQDILDATPINHPKPFFLKVCDWGKYRFLFLGMVNAGQTAYSIYAFDFDSKKWVDFGYSTADYHCVANDVDFSDGHKFKILVGKSTAAQYLNFGADTAYATTAELKSQHLDFGDRNAKKRLDTVVLYVNDAALAWAPQVDFDEAASLKTLEQLTVSSTPRSRGPGVVVFTAKESSSSTLAAQCHSVQLRIPLPAGGRCYKAEIFVTPVSQWDGPRSN